jgi:hypothetical protein
VVAEAITPSYIAASATPNLRPPDVILCLPRGLGCMNQHGPVVLQGFEPVLNVGGGGELSALITDRTIQVGVATIKNNVLDGEVAGAAYQKPLEIIRAAPSSRSLSAHLCIL